MLLGNNMYTWPNCWCHPTHYLLHGWVLNRNGKIKGIFSDSNSTFLWHKSEDIIIETRLFQKFQLILIFCLQVMHDVHWPAPLTRPCCVK